MNIPGTEPFAKMEPLSKGLSGDEKYRVETRQGDRLLLRVSSSAQFARKRAEYQMLKRAEAIGAPVSRPLKFGQLEDGRVYMLLAWCEGVDLEEAMRGMAARERYALGRKAGELLRLLHSAPVAQGAEPWEARFRRKIGEHAAFYARENLRCGEADRVLACLRAGEGVLRGRPLASIHGDFNASNLILGPDGVLRAIDFNAYNGDSGDPWWEFDTIPWGGEADGAYFSGLIHGYFAGEPPEEFFAVLALYSAYGALAALCRTAEHDGGEREDGRRHLKNVLRWYDGFRRAVPVWYEPWGSPPCEIELRPVGRDNFRDVIRLSVSDAQKSFVASNQYSIAQAYAEPECVPRAAYCAGELVGFVMYALDAHDGEYWVYRLMVDEKYQKKGYGRQILRAALREIAAHTERNVVYISFEPENEVARKLYASMGFVPDGRDVGGEIVYRLERGAWDAFAGSAAHADG